MKRSIRGVIFHNSRILLIKRIKKGHNYYVVPGGHVEMDENDWETCVRELKEETGLKVKPIKKFFVTQSKRHKNVFYFCRILHKKKTIDPKKLPIVKLIGEEKDRLSKDNYYEPVWIDVEKINSLRIYPKQIKPILIKLKSYLYNNVKSNS